MALTLSLRGFYCDKVHSCVSEWFGGIKYTHIIAQPSAPSRAFSFCETDELSPLNSNPLPPPPTPGERHLFY